MGMSCLMCSKTIAKAGNKKMLVYHIVSNKIQTKPHATFSGGRWKYFPIWVIIFKQETY